MPSFTMQHSLVSLEILADFILAELADSIPARWKSSFGIKRWVIIDDLQVIKNAEISTRPIAFVISPAEILLRHIELPLISRFHLSNLMKYEIPKHVPLPVGLACFDFRILSRDVLASKMRVELAIIRADAVESLCHNAGSSGIKLNALAIHTKTDIWIARRPLRLNWRQTWLHERILRIWLNFAVPVFLIILFILAIQNWAARVATDRDEDVAIAQSQAIGIEPLRQQLSLLNDKISFLQAARKRPSAALITEQIAKLLPDNAWLQELDIEDQTVQLRGAALHATDLLRIFSVSSMFSNVQFEAPLTQAEGANGQQFDITMNRQ